MNGASSEPASGRAIASLVFGIGGLTFAPCIGPPLAIALGWGERSGIARAGVILGWIALALYALIAGLLLLLLLIGGVASVAH